MSESLKTAKCAPPTTRIYRARHPFGLEIASHPLLERIDIPPLVFRDGNVVLHLKSGATASIPTKDWLKLPNTNLLSTSYEALARTLGIPLVVAQILYEELPAGPGLHR